MSDCRIIAAVNQKGGVGKTNLSTNMSIGLAQQGHKVLIVDLDSQASISVVTGADGAVVFVTSSLENQPPK